MKVHEHVFNPLRRGPGQTGLIGARFEIDKASSTIRRGLGAEGSPMPIASVEEGVQSVCQFLWIGAAKMPVQQNRVELESSPVAVAREASRRGRMRGT